mmetsp:Transcript_8800/g.19155  ORF Transcript_8800/g.19155 Transcript_8800/m.19155 type:complete len:224 (-) Transcript_8800:18-689(-)
MGARAPAPHASSSSEASACASLSDSETLVGCALRARACGHVATYGSSMRSLVCIASTSLFFTSSDSNSSALDTSSACSLASHADEKWRTSSMGPRGSMPCAAGDKPMETAAALSAPTVQPCSGTLLSAASSSRTRIVASSMSAGSACSGPLFSKLSALLSADVSEASSGALAGSAPEAVSVFGSSGGTAELIRVRTGVMAERESRRNKCTGPRRSVCTALVKK